jgi:hypothetical protein
LSILVTQTTIPILKILSNQFQIYGLLQKKGDSNLEEKFLNSDNKSTSSLTTQKEFIKETNKNANASPSSVQQVMLLPTKTKKTELPDRPVRLGGNGSFLVLSAELNSSKEIKEQTANSAVNQILNSSAPISGNNNPSKPNQNKGNKFWLIINQFFKFYNY